MLQRSKIDWISTQKKLNSVNRPYSASRRTYKTYNSAKCAAQIKTFVTNATNLAPSKGSQKNNRTQSHVKIKWNQNTNYFNRFLRQHHQLQWRATAKAEQVALSQNWVLQLPRTAKTAIDVKNVIRLSSSSRKTSSSPPMKKTSLRDSKWTKDRRCRKQNRRWKQQKLKLRKSC